MPESRGRRGRKAARSKPRRRPRQLHPPAEELPLLADIRRAMVDPDPLHLLSMVSMLMYVTDPRSDHPLVGAEEQTSMPRDQLVATFLDVVCPETSALLALFAAMIGDDDVLRARIRRELAVRPKLEPAWLADVGAVRISRAMVMSHVLGDGDNIILGVDLPGGPRGTVIVYIDHNMGTLVKDAFTISEPFDAVLAKYQELSDDPDTTFELSWSSRHGKFLFAGVPGGVVGGVGCPAGPDHSNPAACEDSDGVGMSSAARSGSAVAVAGPG